MSFSRKLYCYTPVLPRSFQPYTSYEQEPRERLHQLHQKNLTIISLTEKSNLQNPYSIRVRKIKKLKMERNNQLLIMASTTEIQITQKKKNYKYFIMVTYRYKLIRNTTTFFLHSEKFLLSQVLKHKGNKN